jgi:hypothetical protein
MTRTSGTQSGSGKGTASFGSRRQLQTLASRRDDTAGEQISPGKPRPPARSNRKRSRRHYPARQLQPDQPRIRATRTRHRAVQASWDSYAPRHDDDPARIIETRQVTCT